MKAPETVVSIEEGSAPLGSESEERGLPSLAILYLASVYAAALAAGGFALSTNASFASDQLAAFAVLSGLAAVAQLFPVDAPSRHSYHTTPVFLLAALLLLDPPLLAAMSVLIMLPEWARYRYPWYIQTFNIATYLLNVLSAWAVFHLVAGGGGLAVSWQVAMATVLAALTFTVANHLLVGLVLWYARGIPFRESGVFGLDSVETDAALLFLGAALAVFWTVHPALILLALVPLFLFHRALHVPQLQEKAYSDAKTGLLTARRFNELLAEEAAKAERSGRPTAVVMADLDLLRNINNTHGHLLGDVALQAAARALRQCLRSGDVAGRLGGEEFALLLPGTDQDEAFALAETIRQEVEDVEIPLPGGDETLRVTMSLGVAAYPDPCSEPGKLLHHADMAVYRSKLAGRNRTNVAIPSLDDVRYSQGSGGNTLEAMVFTLDRRGGADERTLRVTALTLALASQLGISEGCDEWSDLEKASLLHDVGQFALPGDIVYKSASLTEDEWRQVRRHPEIGWEMLRRVAPLVGAAEVVRAHHEHYDGSGYPHGLRGDQIPRGARIFAVADAFDAITSDRPYRDARSHLVAVEEIEAGSGTQFDPQVVDALLRILGHAGPRPSPATARATASTSR